METVARQENRRGTNLLTQRANRAVFGPIRQMQTLTARQELSTQLLYRVDRSPARP